MRGVRGPLRAIIAVTVALYWTGEHERSLGAQEPEPEQGAAAATAAQGADSGADAAATLGIPGPYRHVRLPPPGVPSRRACSFREPVCVEADVGVAGEVTLGVLGVLERTWATLRGPLRIPPPSPSPEGGARFVLHASNGGAATRVEPWGRDPRSAIDRGVAWTQVDVQLGGCALEHAVARAVVGAARIEHVPAMDPGSAEAQVDALARLLTPCAAPEPDALAHFQSNAEWAIPQSLPTRGAREQQLFMHGASAFYDWLDETRGIAPGAVLRALWALSATSTSAGQPEWHNEPDTFDVLSATFADPNAPRLGYDALLLDFAVARAVPVAENIRPWPSGKALARVAPVSADWDLPWPAQPRAVLPRRVIEPTGVGLVRVRTQGRRDNARLRVELLWEEHARLRVALVRVGPNGAFLGRNDLPVAHRKDTQAQMTLVNLEGAESVFVVLMNAGDTAFTFDPDDEAWEGHGYMLTLASEN
jgi:hypothetical protein